MEMGGPTSFEDLVEYSRHIGIDDINHTRGAYLVHAACVYRDLKDWVVRKRSVTLAYIILSAESKAFKALRSLWKNATKLKLYWRARRTVSLS